MENKESHSQSYSTNNILDNSISRQSLNNFYDDFEESEEEKESIEKEDNVKISSIFENINESQEYYSDFNKFLSKESDKKIEGNYIDNIIKNRIYYLVKHI